jgi:hypothetical protein
LQSCGSASSDGETAFGTSSELMRATKILRLLKLGRLLKIFKLLR